MNKIVTKQRVKIVLKDTSGYKHRIYLVWFQNKKRTWEATNEFCFTSPKNPFEKQHNKSVMQKAEIQRNLREQQLFSGEIDDIIEQKINRNQDFTSFFATYLENYYHKDKRVMAAVFMKFKAFAPKYVTAKEIDEKFCIDFKHYLVKTLNGESAPSYFARFKKMLRQATREKLFSQFPAENVVNKSTGVSLVKSVLEVNEIQALQNTQCGNDEVKRAFLFACNTGLRFCDINALKWEHIENDVIKINQIKTKDKARDGGLVEITLNENARTLLGNKGKKEDFIFKLPTSNGTNDILEYWAKRAGLEKHITFHCARHTFGTLLAFYGNDIHIIQRLFGHSSLKYTGRYIRTSEELKLKAVNSIPTIALNNSPI